MWSAARVVERVRIVVDVVVEHDEQLVAEASRGTARGSRAYQPPVMIPSGSRSGGVCSHELEQIGVLRRVPLDAMWWIIADCARSIGLRRIAISRTSGTTSRDPLAARRAGRCRQNM